MNKQTIMSQSLLPRLAGVFCTLMRGPWLTMSAILCSFVASQATAASKPNVLFIMPDDLSYDAYSYYNPHGPQTPNVDRLGRESVRLTDFHVSPTCSPSRAAFMTGRYTNATGAWHTILGREFMWANEVTMAEIFKANGYGTAIFSKWHLGDNYPFRPQDRGFEHTVIARGGGIDQQPDYWGNRNDPPATLYINEKPVVLTEENGGLPGASGAFATNFFTTQAIEYMKAKAREGTPFFAYIPYNVAHGPQDMPPDARPGIDAHTATVENMDKNIGRILDFLDESGLADDTLLVLVLGDNGEATMQYRGGKATEYEAGHCVPCFIRWKNGGIGGSRSGAREVPYITANLDLLPTLMDLIGLHDIPDRPREVPIQGRSFGALLRPQMANAEAVRAELGSRIVVVDNQRQDALIKYKQACIMQNDMDEKGNVSHQWRLILPFRDGKRAPAELYDVQTDPQQKNDLVGDPGLADLVTTLKAAYESWWDSVSLHAPDYARTILGSDVQPEVCLYAHDWHGLEMPPWNQEMITQGQEKNGFHSVAFESPGSYVFDLRRWPTEIAGETTVSSQLKRPIRAGSADNNGHRRLTRGRAMPIRSARIRIWNAEKIYADERKAVDPDSDGAVFKIRSLPAGPAMIQTWFFDEAGNNLCGAYYVYVKRDAN